MLKTILRCAGLVITCCAIAACNETSNTQQSSNPGEATSSPSLAASTETTTPTTSTITASPTTTSTPATTKTDAKNTVTTASGLKYVDLKVGSGATPKTGQTISVHYTGTLENGTKFDSSRDRNEPIEFPLGTGKVIPGWDEGLSTMKVGGRRQLIIPGKLGYGAAGTPDGTIPPNATLLFDVELMGIK
ncbi:FKBP-type peptidyl-prolyl cis-trans isomerase [Brunnivagina elsteri]|uniref:Peptidyl-prolyl cis-trans isomerase n=1 Tax=Brunnivagina elsteri CCALA 953 TaxID=987040 RepID=A0A2A2TCI8_9CYAN|nr:FKBP-type peptidyl-prolyl cis-trans isomerase [Calothrix elsteri]PAX51345.1 peptidylprolyl isomerase [Calothrix elsteri CCALA 953]